MWKLLLPLYDPAFNGEVDIDEDTGIATQTQAPYDGKTTPSISRAWIEWIMSTDNQKGFISKDVWNTSFDLIKDFNQKPGLEEYDLDGGAWPVMIDEFVICFRKKRSGGGSS